MNTQAELNKAIRDKQYHISFIDKKIDSAESFEIAEDYRKDKRKAEFEIKQLEAQLAQVIEADADAARQEAIKSYEASLAEYKQKLADHSSLSEKLITTLKQLEAQLKEHHQLALLLWHEGNRLDEDAEALGLAKPPSGPDSGRDLGGHLVRFVNMNDLTMCYPARLLRFAVESGTSVSMDRGSWIGNGLY